MFMLSYKTCYVMLMLYNMLYYVINMLCYITCYVYVMFYDMFCYVVLYNMLCVYYVI